MRYIYCDLKNTVFVLYLLLASIVILEYEYQYYINISVQYHFGKK